MALSPGSSVGPYEIRGSLGAGGMGEVYRAHDTKLGRDVALKLLPDAFANDPDRLMRFEREARTLASLNHPHIANIYGIEESGGTRALVMELVKGEGLDEKIASRPGRGVPLDEALSIARQIAEALEAAHEAGIIHRDLKPANIRVRADGTVKVLDFGLAKAGAPAKTGAHSDDVGPGFSPASITSPALTMHGMVLGTAAYMAPEQAKGKPLDKRADIWAFGCVLYEMLTAARAFPGEDITDTIAAVVSKEPDWTRLPAATPPAVVRLLRRALVKDRRNRLPDIAAARIEIDEALSSPAETPDAATRDRAGRTLPLWVWGTAAIVVALLAAGGTYLATRASDRPAPVYRSSLLIPENMNGRAPSTRMALSPDGTRLAYVAAGGSDSRLRLWVRALNGATGQGLAGTENAFSPFWSPDGRSIAFFADNQLKKIDVSGGPPVAICTLPISSSSFQAGAGSLAILPGTWSPQGVIVFGYGPLARVPAAGGAPEVISSPDKAAGETSLGHPHFLPDGRHLLFTSYKGIEPITTYVAAIDDAARRKVMDGGGNAQYANGRLLYLRSTTLVAQPFDLARAELSGEATPLADSVLPNLSVPRGGAFTVSQGGSLVYQTAFGIGGVRLMWFTRSGQQTKAVDEEATYRGLALSPDGTRLAFTPLDAGGRSDLWILDLTRGTRTRLSFSGKEQSVVWSPDGREVLFNSETEAGLQLFRKRVDGTGRDESVLVDERPKWPQAWSRDGRFVLFDRFEPATSNDLWLLRLDGAGKAHPLMASTFSERWAQFSPDGRWIAYTSDESGQPQVYLTRGGGSGGRWPVSTQGGSYPRWSPDGKELFFFGTTAIVAVPIAVREDAPDLGPAVKLFDARAPGGFARYFYDIAPDGRFLMSVPASESTTFELTLLVNWPSTLPQR